MTDLLKKTGSILWIPFGIALAIIWGLLTALSGSRRKVSEKDTELSIGKTMNKVEGAHNESKSAEAEYRRAVADYYSGKQPGGGIKK